MKLTHLLFTFCLTLIGAIGYGQTVPGDTTQTDSTQTDSTRTDSTQMDSMKSMQTTSMDAVSTNAVDSAKLLKIQERAGKVSGQLARNRDKLARLEKEYQDKTNNKQKAIESAEASAAANRTAAVELSDDATNRAKARKAEKSASRARRETKSLQRADKNLERLEKDINKVKREIADDEKTLSELQAEK
jgi:chromosome segregation ATPase